jgi:hypothetical protein
MLRDGAHHKGIVVYNSALDEVKVFQELQEMRLFAKRGLYRYCRSVVIVDITSQSAYCA